MPRSPVALHDRNAPFDLVSYGRRGPGHRDHLSLAQIEQVARTVRRVPEVMVKVSGGGKSVGAVKAHFRYIGRKDFEIETEEGETLTGKAAARILIADWELDIDAAESHSVYSGKPGRKPGKLVHNIVLSMPAGTLPKKVLAASRDFARETFALQHRYAMVLHTNEAHPHVHLVVRAMSEQGKRLNIRKATLREWRREFAWHLRTHGVAANATERVIRGSTEPRKLDAIYRAHKDDRSIHMSARKDAVAGELLKDDLRIEPSKVKLAQTRREVERGWRAVSEILSRQGQPELAADAQRFVQQMMPARTEKELIVADFLRGAREPLAR